jgi:hypothetical protein
MALVQPAHSARVTPRWRTRLLYGEAMVTSCGGRALRIFGTVFPQAASPTPGTGRLLFREQGARVVEKPTKILLRTPAVKCYMSGGRWAIIEAGYRAEVMTLLLIVVLAQESRPAQFLPAPL